MKIRKMGLMVIPLFFLCLISNATDYKKEASTAASKPQLSLGELDLINLILTGSNPAAEIKGAEDSSDTVLFSGKNHNTDGDVITGGKYAIGCNIGQGNLTISNVTLEGTNGTIEENVAYSLNISTLAPFLRKNADTTITENTTLQNTTLGSSSDYKIVYVNDSKLTLSTDFTGYGILYIEDKNHAEEESIFEMLNNAIWYGAIIINQTGEDKKSKIFLNGTAGEELPGISDFSMFGIDHLTFGNNAHINSGNIGVSSETGSIVIGNNNKLAGSLLANTIVIGNNCKVDGDVYYNTFISGHNFKLKGEKKTPLSFPYLTLPEFPAFSAGSQSISRNNNATYTLNPGSYKNLTFKNNCTLILTGGEYNIEKLTMGNNCKIKYMAASTVRIKKKFKMGNNPRIIPFPHHGGGISPFMIIAPVAPHCGGKADANDCIFYIEGNGYTGNTDVFKAGNNATLYCNVYAPNAYSVIKLGNNANCKGSFIGNKIIAGNNIKVALKSAFSGSGNGSEAQKVEIYGSLILIGNKFYIPAEGANINGYYCQDALEKVNAELESQPYNIWFEWKEVE